MHLARTVLLAASAAATAGPALMNDIRGSFFDASTLLLPRQTKNLQIFAGALGGIKADAVIETSDTTRPFRVAGDTFPDLSTAAGRSCDNQKNACAQSANNGSKNFTVADCDSQNNQCKASIKTINVNSVGSSSSSSSSSSLSTSATSTLSTTASATLALVSSNAQFNFFCEV